MHVIIVIKLAKYAYKLIKYAYSYNIFIKTLKQLLCYKLKCYKFLILIYTLQGSSLTFGREGGGKEGAIKMC